MKKEFFQHHARQSIHEQLKNGSSLVEIKAFANDALELSHKYPNQIPNYEISNLAVKHPDFTKQFLDILKKESEERDEALKEALRKNISD